MERKGSPPPRLPHLHFGRAETHLQDLHEHTGAHQMRATRPHQTRKPRLAHIGTSRASNFRRSDYYGYQTLPSVTSEFVESADRLYHNPGPHVFPSQSEQLVWSGGSHPEQAHHRSPRTPSQSPVSGVGIHSNEEEDYYEKDLKYEKKDVDSKDVASPEKYSGFIAGADQLSALHARHPLPPLSGWKAWRELRYHYMTFYRRLMTLVLTANIAVLFTLITRHVANHAPKSYRDAATATGVNLLAAVLMRQEHVVNMLFHAALALPDRTPLSIRKCIGKMTYNNGGIHAGAAISALLWYVYYVVLVSRQYQGTKAEEQALTAVTVGLVMLFVVLILLSTPSVRRHYHNVWELSHRFGGWAAVALFWAQTFMLAVANGRKGSQPLGTVLLHLPLFWMLVIITCCLIYPWLRLRRVRLVTHQLSDHATQLRFTNRRLATCRGVRLARNPLLENHGFATIPHGRDEQGVLEKGYSVIISNAGDFTRGIIRRPPQHIWMRGAPTTGVMRLSSLFRPIVIVATGSGIGPCLSFLNRYRGHPKRVLWSARSPITTYGNNIMRDVLRADSKALIIDTKQSGLPNTAALTYALVREIAAEAVMVIANPGVTRHVVYEMEARKIPAFGAVFDS